MHLSILIPAHNELDRLPSTLASLLRNKHDEDTLSVLIANDHSSDAQVHKLAQHCDDTLKNTTLTSPYCIHIEDVPSPSVNASSDQIYFWDQKGTQGKGESLNFLSHHIPSLSEYVLLIDADLCESAGQCYQLVQAVQTKRCELAIAAFRKPTDSRTQSPKGFGQVLKLARKELRTAQIQAPQSHAQELEWISPLSGQRALSYENFQKLLPLAPGFGVELIMSLQALQLGLHIQEIELELSHRYTKRNISGTWHRLKQYCDIRKALRNYQLQQGT